MKVTCEAVELVLLRGVAPDESVRGHLAQCASCAAVERAVRVLSDVGVSAREGRLDPDRVAVLRERVAVELAARRGGGGVAARRGLWRGWLLRAAALVLLCAGWWVWRLSGPAAGIGAGGAGSDVAAVAGLDAEIEEKGLALSDSLRQFEARHWAGDEYGGSAVLLGGLPSWGGSVRADRW